MYLLFISFSFERCSSLLSLSVMCKITQTNRIPSWSSFFFFNFYGVALTTNEKEKTLLCNYAIIATSMQLIAGWFEEPRLVSID